MKMPNFAWSNHSGSGLESTDSQFGSYLALLAPSSTKQTIGTPAKKVPILSRAKMILLDGLAVICQRRTITWWAGDKKININKYYNIFKVRWVSASAKLRLRWILIPGISVYFTKRCERQHRPRGLRQELNISRSIKISRMRRSHPRFHACADHIPRTVLVWATHARLRRLPLSHLCRGFWRGVNKN